VLVETFCPPQRVRLRRGWWQRSVLCRDWIKPVSAVSLNPRSTSPVTRREKIRFSASPRPIHKPPSQKTENCQSERIKKHIAKVKMQVLRSLRISCNYNTTPNIAQTVRQTVDCKRQGEDCPETATGTARSVPQGLGRNGRARVDQEIT
jgi:hypothetical protein